MSFSALPVFCIDVPTKLSEDVNGVMSPKYWELWNDDIQKKIDADIEKYRKADACVQVGEIKEGTQVSVEQISHDFKFGAHIFNYNQLGDKTLNAKYKSLYGTLFNSATVAFYWNKFEIEKNRPRFKSEYWDTSEYWENSKNPKAEFHWRRPPTDEVIDYCKSRGVRVHGHAIVWGSRAYSIPQWLFDYCLQGEEKKRFDSIIASPFKDGQKCVAEKYKSSFNKLSAKQLDEMFPNFADKFKELHNKRIIELAEYYGDKVDSWDIVNESLPDSIGDTKNIGGKITKSERYKIMPADYTFEAFKTATAVFPKSVKLNINDSPYRWIEHYAPQVNDLKQRGCKIDIVGVQMHIFKPAYIAKIASGVSDDNKWFKIDEKKLQPKEVWKMMDIIDTNTPIHMSEITITSPDATPKGWAIQAVITRNMYRLWFSLKNVMGITWWNVVDDCGVIGEPSHSGLFTRTMQPKPAGEVLQDLINNQWKTNLKAIPNSEGNIKFRGFKGRYRLTWIDTNGNEKFKFVDVK